MFVRVGRLARVPQFAVFGIQPFDLPTQFLEFGILVTLLLALLAAIARYCVYDSRKKRLNHTQIQEQVFARMALP